MGAQFFVALFAFVYAGNWMDARFGMSPVFLLIGLFVGGGGSFYTSYRQVMRRTNATTQDGAARSHRSPRV
jgi:F0F1-type ATP synthase assembly protein I